MQLSVGMFVGQQLRRQALDTNGPLMHHQKRDYMMAAHICLSKCLLVCSLDDKGGVRCSQ